jgi:hypothetical protein
LRVLKVSPRKEEKMSNQTRFYFGAYLEISTKKIKKTRHSLVCKNGHQDEHGPYCSQCGSFIGQRAKTVSVYPTWIHEVLLGEKWEDVLREITPPELREAGKIIAISNWIPARSEWLHLGGYHQEVQTKDFPSPDDIATMISDIQTKYADIIEALQRSETVIGVSVKAGYVLDQEY